MIITIVAFKDNQLKSVSYKKFKINEKEGIDEIDKAIKFYIDMLGRNDVRVISTRKVKNGK